MKDLVKKRILFFDWDYKAEENFLRKMHQEGLALEKHDGSCSYLFSKTKPSDMTYRKAYKEFNSEDEKKAYIQVFEDSGWEYIDEKKTFITLGVLVIV